MIRISFLFHYQNSLPFVLDAFFTTKECEAASHPEVRYTPMCTDGASLDSELEEGEWGGRHFSGFSIQVVKGDEGLHIRFLRSAPSYPRVLQLLQLRFGYEGI